jgi:hypothetical protein
MVDVVLQPEVRFASSACTASAFAGVSSQKPGMSTRLLIGSIKSRMPWRREARCGGVRLALKVASIAAAGTSAGATPARQLSCRQSSARA